MKILAIETTALPASAAIFDDGKIIADFTINFKKTHSQTILPIINFIFEITEIDLNTIDYIACSAGPGSFTGLRIGAATAKGISHALYKKIIPIPTLDGLAYNLFQNNNIIVPIMDAKRNQVYTAFYSWENGKLIRNSDYMADDINNVLEKVSSFKKNAVFLGDGVPVFKDIIHNYNPSYLFAPTHICMQRASSIAAIAAKYFDDYKKVNPSDFEIIYLRKSQAEREYDERNSLKND